MNLLNTHSITVKRETDKSYFSGGKKHYKTVDMLIEASVQPITGNDLNQLKDFAQDLEKIKIWSDDEVKLNDLIVYENVTFRVIKVKDYTKFPVSINHFERMCVEVKKWAQ